MFYYIYMFIFLFYYIYIYIFILLFSNNNTNNTIIIIIYNDIIKKLFIYILNIIFNLYNLLIRILDTLNIKKLPSNIFKLNNLEVLYVLLLNKKKIFFFF